MSSSTTFTKSEIDRLRHKAAKAAAPPNKFPEGWSFSRVDPQKTLAVFKNLKLKEGFVLRAYQFREGDNGNGIVWAMPEDAAFPIPQKCPRLEDSFLNPPKPAESLDNFMDAVEGDSTPLSYLSASILARELSEFGAMWHGCSWSAQVILDKDPWETSRMDQEDSELDFTGKWTWIKNKPKNWKPEVVQGDDEVTVIFYTFTGLEQQRIFRIADFYESGRYHFTTERKTIANGPYGYIH